MERKKITTTLRMDQEDYRKAQIIAADQGRSLNAQILFFIRRGIESYEHYYGKIDSSDDDK